MCPRSRRGAPPATREAAPREPGPSSTPRVSFMERARRLVKGWVSNSWGYPSSSTACLCVRCTWVRAAFIERRSRAQRARGRPTRVQSSRHQLGRPSRQQASRPSRPEFRQKRWPTHPRRPSARAPTRRCHRLPSCLTSRPRLQRAARAAAAAPAQRSSPRWMMCWPPSHHRPRVGRPPRRLRALQPRRSKSSLGLHLACSP